ncbi:hypothetical protein [Psychrobacter sp. Pi2-51]|uniref:hypothetical protein n=1 Tax=Psychrobacter sp. Pi2-51 TaxID=2774132 RepID=UPI00191AC28F|nr:hypothetical protein [Psychrobacter sp. Pi2-51]
MSDNDIALSFDTLEYYSLQEACDYLNRKHKTNNITPKKLLKKISSRDINTFIHFRMDSSPNKPLHAKIEFYNSNVFSTDINIYDLSEKELKPIVDTLQKLETFVSNRIIDDLYMGSFLFRVSKETVSNMTLSKNPDDKIFLFGLEGFIQRPNYNDDPYKPSQLAEWQITVEDKSYQLTDISYINFTIDSVNDEDLAKFAEKAPFSCSFNKRADFSFVEFNIKLSDIIILHNDLLSLEEESLNNKPIESKGKFVSRKGVSHKKILAKEIAKHVAEEQWLQDTENKIKIGEMCNIVWAKLIEYNLSEELPNHIDNLRPWIKEVSPSYASEAGRPKS